MNDAVTSPPGIGHARNAPRHVPAELVRAIDLQAAPDMSRCPHAAYSRLHEGPRIFYNMAPPLPHGEVGIWVPTRAEDLRAILQDPTIFSSKKVANFSGLMGEQWDLIPAEIDPPAHRAYRKMLDPFFSPGVVAALDDRVRSHAVDLIDKALAKDGCDFVSEFSEPFPILIFLALMGIDEGHFNDILGWADQLHHGADMAACSAGASAIGQFLRAEIADRLKTPKDDVISKIVRSQLDGRALTDDEMIGIIYLLFTGGVDTVTGSLGFHFLHLARDPDLQARLRADESAIPVAVNELLRANSVVNSYRRVVTDTTIAGVTMKAGDWVMVSLPIVNLDPDVFPHPTEIDLNRKVNRHLGFSYGTHFCLGMHLALRELKVAYEEWLRRAPPFRLSGEPKIVAGTLLTVRSLPLAWN